MPNFSWTPPMFFQVPGTMHKKVKEIIFFLFFFALNFLQYKITALEKKSKKKIKKRRRLMVLALRFVYHTGAQRDKHFINHSWTYKGLLLRCVLFHGLCFRQIFKYLFGLLSNPFFFIL